MTLSNRIAKLYAKPDWTAQDDATLVSTIKGGGSVQDAADATGRAFGTVQDRWFALCRAASNGRSCVTQDEFDALEAAVLEKVSAHDGQA